MKCYECNEQAILKVFHTFKYLYCKKCKVEVLPRKTEKIIRYMEDKETYSIKSIYNGYSVTIETDFFAEKAGFYTFDFSYPDHTSSKEELESEIKRTLKIEEL